MRDPIQNLVLVHGAGSGPWVFDEWGEHFPDLSVLAVDLHDGLDVGRASMTDYRDQVADCMSEIDGESALCGWSMGGLVALMAAEIVCPQILMLIESSPPGEVQGFDPAVLLGNGTFDPETVYGPFPSGMRSRPESLRARAERKRGISVPNVPSRTIVISGAEFPIDRGESIAGLYGAEHLRFEGLSHWDLVLRPEARGAIASRVSRV